MDETTWEITLEFPKGEVIILNSEGASADIAISKALNKFSVSAKRIGNSPFTN